MEETGGNIIDYRRLLFLPLKLYNSVVVLQIDNSILHDANCLVSLYVFLLDLNTMRNLSQT